MTPNDHYSEIAARILSRPVETWLPKPTAKRRNDVADAIVKVVQECGFSHMLLARLVKGSVTKVDVEAHVRRGWAFMCSVLGETVATDIVSKAGAVCALAGVRTLHNFCVRDTQCDEENDFAFLASMTCSMVSILAEYNGVDGLPIAEKIVHDVPLRQGERDAVLENCAYMDFSQRTLH